MTDLFKNKSEMPAERNSEGFGYGVSVPGSGEYKAPPSVFPAGSSMTVCMTPGQERDLRMSNYPRYDALDVEHVRRPRFGKGM